MDFLKAVQRQWRSAGHAPAADAAALLTRVADELRRVGPAVAADELASVTDRAGADQRRRLSCTFQPLGQVDPTAVPGPPAADTRTQRTERTR